MKKEDNIDTLKDSNVDTEFEDVKEKSSGLKIGLIVVLVIAVVVCAGYFAFKSFSSANPKKVYETAINDTIKQINNVLDSSKTFNTIEGKMKLEVSGLMFEMMGFNILNDYEVSYSAKTDAKKNSLVSFTVSDTKSKVNAITNLYLKDGKSYVEFKDAYKNIIELGKSDELTSSLETMLNITTSEDVTKINYLITKISNLFLDSLEEDNFKKEKAEIKVNNKEYSVDAYAYKFDNENMKKTSKFVADGILKDETSLNYLASLTDSNVEDIKQSLEEAVNPTTDPELTGKENTDQTATMYVYTKGIKAESVGIALINDDTNLYYYHVDDDFRLEFENAFKVEGNTSKGGNVDVSMYDAEKKEYKKLLTVTVKESSEENINYDFAFAEFEAAEGETIPSIDGNITATSKTEGTKTIENMVLTLNLKIEGVTSTIKLTVDATGDTATPELNIDIKNPVSIDKVNSDKLSQALTKYYSKFSIVKFFETMGAQQ